MDFGDLAPTQPQVTAWGWGCDDLRSAVMTWKGLNSVDLVALNATLTKDGLHAISGATRMLAVPVCAAAGNAKH